MTDIQAQMIDFPSNGHTTPGYLAQPTEGGPYPGIVCIQEWWGLVGHIKDVANRLAREGFVVLAPDLYHGEEADEPDEARKLAMRLDRNRAVAEIAAAAVYLKGLDKVIPKKIGTVGWCMGGGLSLSTAAYSGDIGAAVCFYGSPLSADDTAKVGAPVLGLFAEEDHGISVQGVREFELELRRNNIEHEVHIYPGTHHAFFNDEYPVYNAAASADAWQKTLGWFRAHLTD